MKTIDALFAFGFGLLVLTSTVSADLVVNHPAVAGGGVSRDSQLWQDPGPNGNDLDGDAVVTVGSEIRREGAVVSNVTYTSSEIAITVVR